LIVVGVDERRRDRAADRRDHREAARVAADQRSGGRLGQIRLLGQEDVASRVRKLCRSPVNASGTAVSIALSSAGRLASSAASASGASAGTSPPAQASRK
ncbi:MAG TPA: hypothetical protein VFD36_22665, partial [Kofleriaceae bacterium]|nr:hypothetical protein [Kofleriaceae bacterium]